MKYHDQPIFWVDAADAHKKATSIISPISLRVSSLPVYGTTEKASQLIQVGKHATLQSVVGSGRGLSHHGLRLRTCDVGATAEAAGYGHVSICRTRA